MREKLSTVTSRVVPLAADDIDTDQIIPARYLKVTDKVGLGAHLFQDWRYEPSGAPRPGFALNLDENRGARVLIGGNNFGCGSSREHAAWALTDWGIKAVIARSFADIFRSNALKNGLVPVIVDAEVHAYLVKARAADPQLGVTVDVTAAQLRLPDGRSVGFPLDPFAQRCLVEGLDELAYLQKHEGQIAAWEARHA